MAEKNRAFGPWNSEWSELWGVPSALFLYDAWWQKFRKGCCHPHCHMLQRGRKFLSHQWKKIFLKLVPMYSSTPITYSKLQTESRYLKYLERYSQNKVLWQMWHVTNPKCHICHKNQQLLFSFYSDLFELENYHHYRVIVGAEHTGDNNILRSLSPAEI